MKHFKKKDFLMLLSFIFVLGFLFIFYFNLQSRSPFIPDVDAQMYMNYASFISPCSGLISTFPGIGDYYAGFMVGGPFSQLSSSYGTYDSTLSEYMRGMNTESYYNLESWIDSRHVSRISDTASIYNIVRSNIDYNLLYMSANPKISELSITFKQWIPQPWSRSIFPQQDIGIWDFYRSGYPSQMLINAY